MHQTTTVQQRGPWSSEGKGSHDWVFRRSIAWLSDSLFTLRSAGYPTTTQNSLPVAGQALLDGIHTRKIPTKGFRIDPQTTRVFSGCRSADDSVIISISALCKLADWFEKRALVADQGGQKCLPTPQEGSPPAPTANVGPNAVGAALARGIPGKCPAPHTADAEPRNTTTTCHSRHTSAVDFAAEDTDVKRDAQGNTDDTNNHFASSRRGGDA